MTVDLSKLSNFISRKVAALVLLGVLLYELPDFGSTGVVIAKVLVAGLTVIVYTHCNTKQNICEIENLKTDPDLTDGATLEPKK